jgi:hypothetical protein
VGQLNNPHQRNLVGYFLCGNAVFAEEFLSIIHVRNGVRNGGYASLELCGF